LERLFYHRRYRRMRADLRAFAHEAQEHDLGEQLGSAIAALCTLLGHRAGWIAVRESAGLSIVAKHPASAMPALTGVLADTPGETTSYDAPTLSELSLDNATVCPLYAGGELLGTLTVVDRAGGPVDGTPLELDLLETVADQIAGLLYTVRQQEDAARQIDEMVRGFRAREEGLRRELRSVLAAGEEAQSGPELRPQVEDALRHLYDYAYLGQHSLAALTAVARYLDPSHEVVTNLDRGRALSQLLIDLIGRLRPPGAAPSPLPREWVQYTILHDAYVVGELNREIMAKLYVSESTFNRARRRAVRGIVRAVKELDRAARQRPP
jgi:GAF domain-containing protein